MTAPEERAVHVQKRPRRRLWLILGGLVGVLIVLGGGGFLVGTALEEQDTFCASCHTPSEVTYFNRAYMALDQPAETTVDLATAHYRAAQASRTVFKCIDCHRGDAGLSHRVTALALGAYDAVVFFAGRDDPTIEKHKTKTGWLANAACTTCHGETLLYLDGINNHFHSYLPAARVALERGGTLRISDAVRESGREGARVNSSGESPFTLKTIDGVVPIQCSDCHQPHKAQPESATSYFMAKDLRIATCVDCHIAAKQGPQSVRELSGEEGEGD
ncbi:MAG TPA: cytochrome c3 family protein [Aggregatilineales bacterium]|nr:hypothetical protein [Anaerolineales bacterium]HRE48271.1 cytochrome c3 family protein [Aggregatilineales bacterium]